MATEAKSMQTESGFAEGGRARALMLTLYQPDIPQNAGTLLRTCACLGVPASIIEPAGFPTSDRHFRRAGMDYLDHVEIIRHSSFAAFQTWRAESRPLRRLVLLSTAAEMDYLDAVYEPNDIIMVGRESAGVPETVHEAADLRVTIRMKPPMRSLNVAIAAALVLGEALRQIRHVG
jgi:tRNA (cytidine/uridine-2'-O-)-methyltransferase